MSLSTMPASQTSDEAPEEQKKKGGKKKLFLIILVVLLAAGAAWYFVLRPHPVAEPQPGTVLPLEAQQVNLAAGHYLSVGIALQLVAGAGEEVDGSKALDATIEIFSNKAVSDLTLPEQREALKAQLLTELKHRYEDEVMDVYFTQFVTQ